MRFEQLRYLDTAIRAGTLRKAAEQLGLAQPSLSQQIRRLEEELNLILLLRNSSGVQATEACLALLPQLRSVLRAEEALLQEASAIGGASKGTVRLGAVGLPTRLLLPNVVRRFHQSHPGVNLEAHEGNSQQLRREIADGDLDIGIISRLSATDWDSQSLRSDDILTGVPLDLCVPAGHKLFGREQVGVAELEGERFVIPPAGHLLRMAFERIRKEVAVGVAYVTDTSETSRIMVAAGVGISVLARPSIVGTTEDLEHRICAVPIVESWSQASMSIVRRKHELAPPAVRALLGLIVEESHRLMTLDAFG